jgi:hypothetical protein
LPKPLWDGSNSKIDDILTICKLYEIMVWIAAVIGTSGQQTANETKVMNIVFFSSEPGRVGCGITGATRPGSDFLCDILFETQ